MTLTNPKPLGWAYGEILTSAQANSIGTQLPYALDGNGGGTYEPSAPIIVGGSGLQIAKMRWPAALLPSFVTVGSWTLSLHNVWRYDTSTASTNDQLHLTLPITWTAGTLSAVRIWVCATHSATNSPGELPATLPELAVFKRSFPGSPGPNPTATQLGSTASDTSSTLTAYKTAHYIEVSGLSESIDLSEVYSIRINASSGDDGADDDFMVMSVEAELAV